MHQLLPPLAPGGRRSRGCAAALLIAACVGLLTVLPAGVAAGPTGGALPPQLVRIIDVTEFGIPADAEMVAANVTAVTPNGPGHATLYPCDEDIPNTSNLNYLADDVVPNLTLTRIADDHTICVATHAAADYVVDLIGYVPAGSDITALPTPQRIRDTRQTGIVRAGTTLDLPLAGVKGIAPDADLVMFNLTAVLARDRGHATVYPCTPTVPNTSSLNFTTGRTIANFVVAPLSGTGHTCIHVAATTHLIIDAVAYTTDAITTLPEPLRVLDTRRTGPTPGAKTVTRVDITGQPGIPDNATAAVYNLTADRAQGRGHATSYPCTPTPPDASNLNYQPGITTANGTITKLAPTGELCIYTHAPTDILIDLIAYTTNTTHYTPITPTRAWDSRKEEIECRYAFVVHQPADRATVVDLRTSTVTEVPLPAGLTQSGVVERGCASMLLYGTVNGKTGLHRVHPSGAHQFVTSTSRTPSGPPNPLVGTGDHGEVYMSAFDGLVDARNGDVLYSVPLGFDVESYILDVDDEITLALIREQLVDGDLNPTGEYRLLLYDTVGDEILSIVPSNGLLSPDGRYFVRSERIGDARTRLTVSTLYGDRVNSATITGDTVGFGWTGTGDLLVCANVVRAGLPGLVYDAERSIYRWRVFAKPELVERELHNGSTSEPYDTRSCEGILSR